VGAAALLLAGAVPLRAAAVSVDGAGVLICGTSARGKSTLAAALGMRGHPVLSDGIGIASGGPPMLQPLGGEVQLWPDMIAALGLDGAPSRVVRPGLAKRAIRLGGAPAPVPLRALVVLGGGKVPEFELLATAGDRIRALLALHWHPGLVDPLGRGPAQFTTLTALAGVAVAARISDGAHRENSRDHLPDLVEGLLR
jgi:hypothetical protein